MKTWTTTLDDGKTSKVANCSAIFLRFRTSWKNQTNSLLAMCDIQSGESVTFVVQTQKTQLNTSHPNLSPWARVLEARWDPQATASPPWAPARLVAWELV